MKRINLLILALCFALSGYAQDLTLAAKKSLHSVVYIQCLAHQQSSYYDDFFDNDFFNNFFGYNPFQQRQRTYRTSGSGVIVSQDGYIVTNNHVVADADSITITLNDKREFVARIVGTDPSSDLAVVKIETNDLTPLEYGNSDNVEIGQWVLAVGNPFNLTSTVTAGIVSAKARNLNILSDKNNRNMLTSFIQTDAAMNPGNSGGALVDTEGKLIGVNVAIASSTGSYMGYSFAIPVNIAKKVIKDLIQYGTTQKASMGAILQEVDSRLMIEKNLYDMRGVYVAKVNEGGASEKAGIKEGDVIYKINGREVNTNSEVNEIMAQMSPNEVAHFEILRNRTSISKDVTLLNESNNTEIVRDNAETAEAVGCTFREVNNNEKSSYGISRGLVITKMGKSRLSSVGIRSGFIITAIDGKVHLSLSDVKALAKKKGQTQIEGFYPNDNRTYSYILVL
ncbi:MAG: trypsin-like peptidase domain-containing protein [Bacteroidales bacterium]|nr:trypsin-like peptidase domain-containing protein [Bacteroidales bacterium]